MFNPKSAMILKNKISDESVVQFWSHQSQIC